MTDDAPRPPSGDDMPGLPGLDAAPAGAAAGHYRVLARKYRPQRFEDLIGQQAMVRTIANSFSAGRIPQAWILTGVRGVGKTTTARILARALNYDAPDATGPSADMPREGRHCRAIMESRHIDVQEIDAASHTGIDDVRQITDSARFAPASARYKVFIVDEVHMLSEKAWNAFLKTLEEPPPHVKFVFATTEIRKVPVTVLSRCQRFDLRRVESADLVAHLEGICAREGVATEPAALALIARAAEGSVRDALSLLDQAIAHGDGRVSAGEVRAMLGLADRARVVDLFEALMKGDMARALGEFRSQYDAGADPVTIISDLAEFTHFVTRVKVVPAVAEDSALVEEERIRGRAFAAGLSMRVLARCWQMLLKGLAEVTAHGKPVQAAEMLLVRIAHASDLPTPDETLRRLADMPAPSPAPAAFHAPGTGAASPARALREARGQPQAALARARPLEEEPAPAVARVESLEDIAALAGRMRDVTLKFAIETGVRPVSFEDGRVEIELAGASPTILSELSEKLRVWTGRRWVVALAKEGGGATIAERRRESEDRLRHGVAADPRVRAVLERFPGAEIVAVRERAAAVAPPVEEDGEPTETGDDGSAFGETLGGPRADDGD